MIRKLLSLILIFILVISLSACGSGSVDIIDGGAEQFAFGKDEEDYSFNNLNDLLDNLIEHYSDSYYNPVGTPMTEDEHDDLIVHIDDIPGSDEVVSVGNIDELIDAVYNAYADLDELLRFKTINGYSPDLLDIIQRVHWEVQRKDPVVGTGISGWSWWQSTDGSYDLQINYQFSKSELARMRKEASAAVVRVAAQLNKNNMNDYEKVCAVNNYLCDTVYYPPNEPYEDVTHSVYGALINGCAVCEGYACAAKAILTEMNVLSDIEVGYCTNGGCHAWNLVNVDGDWYQLDVTWNDASNRRDIYLLVTDDYMRQSRSWDTAWYPTTPSRKYKP